VCADLWVQFGVDVVGARFSLWIAFVAPPGLVPVRHSVCLVGPNGRGAVPERCPDGYWCGQVTDHSVAHVYGTHPNRVHCGHFDCVNTVAGSCVL